MINNRLIWETIASINLSEVVICTLYNEVTHRPNITIVEELSELVWDDLTSTKLIETYEKLIGGDPNERWDDFIDEVCEEKFSAAFPRNAKAKGVKI
tara:strand:+ start:70 stop:360 length:291 start_codon:yes stop_codon:yes gene_type:complete